MKYGVRVLLNPETRSRENAQIVGRMVFDAFERKFSEENIDVKGDLYADIIISDEVNCSTGKN